MPTSSSPPAVAAGTTRAVPALAIGVVAISFAAIFFREAAPTHPLVAAGIRLAIAATILAVPTLRARGAGRLPGPVLRAGIAAGCLYGLHFGAWVGALGLTTVASAVTLVTATPLLLAVIALVTGRDRPDARLWGSLALATTGVAVIGGADLSLSSDALAGDALALLGAAAMAGYLLLVRSLGPTLDVLAFSGVATASGAVVLLGTAAAAGVPLEAASPEALGWLVLAALVPQLIGHTSLTWALRHTSPTTVGLATVAEPVISTALAWLWLGERVGPVVLIGCTITLTAVVMALSRRDVG